MSKEPLKDNYRSFKQIVNIFYNEEVNGIGVEEETILKNEGTIKIEPTNFQEI